jgi:dienelactone hydrolase
MPSTEPTQTPLDPQRRKTYLVGKSGVFALASDPRFSYCLYVPQGGPHPGASRPLVVAVHHSLRNFMQCRDLFADFAQQHGLVVLAPLFPIGVLGNGDPDGYKYLIEDGLRYDLILDAMIEAAARDTGCDRERLCLFGYSGGGHFAHRYLLLHAARLRAVSIGAPGQVTTLDPALDWWAGVRDVESRFGIPIDVQALQRVPVQLLIGEHDRGTGELSHAEGSRYWRPQPQRHGDNRFERLQALRDALQDAGVETCFEQLPGVHHDDGTEPAVAAAQAFFLRHL